MLARLQGMVQTLQAGDAPADEPTPVSTVAPAEADTNSEAELVLTFDAAMLTARPMPAASVPIAIAVPVGNAAAAVPLAPLRYSLDSTLGYEISQPEGR